MLKLTNYDYHLPEKLIAQYPSGQRDEARLMVVYKGKIQHSVFKDLVRYLQPGDLLILNDAKVIPARLKAKKEISGGKIEILLLRELDKNLWEALAKGSKRLKCGMNICFKKSQLAAEIVEKKENGKIILKFAASGRLKKILWELGEIPLPPYIKREVEEIDSYRYQTVFASSEGAVAAPTAGLHFTPELIEKLKKLGIDLAFLTLNVGWGTFSPIRKEDLTDHRMEEESFYLSPEAAHKINEARRNKQRIIAVGTTTVRVLETLADENKEILPGKGVTNLFICPGYKFKIVEGLITNFHLPKTTLFLLVCAFLNREDIFNAYSQAIKREYRFYSYGDAMLLLK